MYNRNILVAELTELMNKLGLDNDCDTPDFILAEYLANSYESLRTALKGRDVWYNFDPWKDKLVIDKKED